MKVDNANLILSSQHSSTEKHSVTESLRMWTGNRRPDFEQREGASPIPRHTPDKVTLSDAGRAAAADKAAVPDDMDDAVKGDPRMQLLIAMVEKMTGRKIRIFSADDLKSDTPPPPEIKDPKQAAPAQPPSAGFGVEYDYHESHHESEQTRFAAEGVVRTADGREIRFSLQLEMSREFSREVDVSVRLGDATRQKKDPLVINFNGTAAQLTDQTFSFDLDTDGKADNINFVGAGSGFLALDRNGDGRINNGSELFGPATGNGFSELATYDQDHNGWIDENDAVYKDLRIWAKDAKGDDMLSDLKEKSVGAIALANAGTEFSIKNADNDLQGQVRSTGIYLSEDGSAGTVQQIDLAV